MESNENMAGSEGLYYTFFVDYSKFILDKKYDDALSFVEKTIISQDLSKTNTISLLLYFKGRIYELMNRKDDAASMYTESLKYNPELPESLTPLIKYHMEKGNHELAMPLISKAIANVRKQKESNETQFQEVQDVYTEEESKLLQILAKAEGK